MTRCLLLFFFSHASGMPSIEVAFQGEEIVPAGNLPRAKDLAAAILGRAGIRVRWSAAPGAIQIRFLAAPPAGLHPDAAGFAVLSQNYAAVCWSSVAETASNLDVEPWTVLGATIAHELGHILLRSKAHSSGVMSYRFDLPQMRAAQRGDLLFAAADARRLRDAAASGAHP